MLDKIARDVYVPDRAEAGCRLVPIVSHKALLDLLDRVARLEQVGTHDDDPLAGRKTG
jgi:hypothetical protein